MGGHVYGPSNTERWICNEAIFDQEMFADITESLKRNNSLTDGGSWNCAVAFVKDGGEILCILSLSQNKYDREVSAVIGNR